MILYAEMVCDYDNCLNLISNFNRIHRLTINHASPF